MVKSTNNLVTKRYLDSRLKRFKIELSDDIKGFKDEIKNELYEIKDEIVGEIRDMRQEPGAHQHSHTRIDNKLQNHEKRVIKLESAQT